MTALRAFPKSRRLLKTDEFSSVFHFKCWVKGKYFRVLARPNGLRSPRLGLVVSKRTFPKAVHRNIVKRISREIFRDGQWSLEGLDVIIQLHSPFDLREKQVIRHELIGLLGEIRKCLAS